MATTALVRTLPSVGPSAVKPSRVCLNVALNVPVWPSAGVGFARFGMSSQFGVAELAKTFAWTVPKIFTGNRDVDSTLVCASSATCAVRSSTAGSCRRLIAWLSRRVRGLQRGKFRAQLGDLCSHLRQLPSDVVLLLSGCRHVDHGEQKQQKSNAPDLGEAHPHKTHVLPENNNR